MRSTARFCLYSLMTNTHTDYRICVQAFRAYFILLKIISRGYSCFNVFVLWLFSFVCISYTASTLCKFYHIHQIPSENANFFLTPLQIYYHSITMTNQPTFPIYKSPRGMLSKVHHVFWSSKDAIVTFSLEYSH